MPPPENPPLSFDIEQLDDLVAYLRATGRVEPDELIHAKVLVGGVSNRTVLVERTAGPDMVLKQALPKLRVSVDWFSDPARIHREALGLRHLQQLASPGTITPFVFEDFSNHILAMHAVPQPHFNLKSSLLEDPPPTAQMPDWARQFGALLGTIHGRSQNQWQELSVLFKDRSFFESLRLEPYYEYSATVEPRAASFLLDLVQMTHKRRLALVHGDYSPKNILVAEGRLILLDHEVIHWGDPAFDLGFALAHLLSKARHRPKYRADFLSMARQFWTAYCQSLGSVGWNTDLEWWAVRHTLACLLARAIGRSPLEYLDTDERERQRNAVLHVIGSAKSGLDLHLDFRLDELFDRIVTES
jgi:tRNA A-37 threonylcarbamoyl transferase component Bud32